MSQCVVPNWNLRHERQEQVEGGESNRSSHVNNNNNHNNNQQQQQQQQHNLITNHDLFPMSNYEVAELTWQNGQLAMHGLGGLLPTAPTKPTWGRSNDTLESIVHQATYHKQGDQPLNLLQHHHKNTPPNLPSMVAPSASKWSESSSGRVQIVPGLLKKRTRADSDQCMHDDGADMSACASASATFCRDSDTTMVTWASYESPRSLKTRTLDEDSACHGGSENQDEDRETKAETGRSRSSRRSRAAAVHNQSERRRRDRINQKMKALQKLVPNASKTDKASMLDEVIEYLKQLQAQVQMMSVSRSMPQMMMPLGIQQHIQMSLLARMGMGVGLGMGMGMIDMNAAAAISRGPPPQSLPSLIHPPPASATTPTFVPSPFLMPSMIPTTCQPPPQPNSEPGDTSSSVPLPDPYCAFLAQSMNMELYNKMAALYRQQVNQATQATSSPSQSGLVQSD